MADNIEKPLKRLDPSKSITIVSGLPRSGTSMMMKMLESGGLDTLTDHLKIPDENNPYGYYEFERVRALKAGDYEWLPDVRGRAVKVVSPLLEYLPHSYEYKIVFMRRNMDEVLASQRQQIFEDFVRDDPASDSKLAEIYKSHLQDVENWLEQQPNISTLYVSYNQVLRDPLWNLNLINQFLGGSLDPETMLQVIDPDLYRERRAA